MNVITPGETIGGRYRLERRLGGGSMGSVWLAEDTALGRPVAVKSVGGALSGHNAATGGAERAMREARVLARVNHPHAVSIYDVVQDDAGPWLVMEYVPSQNLAELVDERGPLDPRHAAELGAQVADALATVHAAGIVHRDVKPANVLISERRTAKITDFGIARGAEDATLTATGMLWGTPAYFAPEVAAGAEAAGEKADVWALAATMYYAVEGTPPHGTDGSPLALLGRIANQPVPPPHRAGPLTPVLARLLDRDPAGRPAMREAAEALGRVASGRTGVEDTPAAVTAPDDTVTGAAQPAPAGTGAGPGSGPGTGPGTGGATERGRRRRVLPVLLVLLLIAGVLGAGWWLLGPDGESGADPDTPAASAPPGGETSAQPTPETAPESTPETTPESTPENTPTEQSRPAELFTAPRMRSAVADYYSILPGDTETGFELLGPSLKSQGFGSYDSFWSGIDSVGVRDLSADPGSRTVTGTVVFVRSDGSRSVERHQFGLVPNGSGDRLLINTDDLVG